MNTTLTCSRLLLFSSTLITFFFETFGVASPSVNSASSTSSSSGVMTASSTSQLSAGSVSVNSYCNINSLLCISYKVSHAQAICMLIYNNISNDNTHTHTLKDLSIFVYFFIFVSNESFLKTNSTRVKYFHTKSCEIF